jgi:hypothetical protein
MASEQTILFIEEDSDYRRWHMEALATGGFNRANGFRVVCAKFLRGGYNYLRCYKGKPAAAVVTTWKSTHKVGSYDPYTSVHLIHDMREGLLSPWCMNIPVVVLTMDDRKTEQLVAKYPATSTLFKGHAGLVSGELQRLMTPQ